MSATRTRVYRDGQVIAQDCPHEDLVRHIADQGCTVWIDLCGSVDGDLDRLAERLGLHELAVEDALEPHQRPKLDRYPDHLFLSCRAAVAEVADAELVESEIDAFIGDHWMITVRPDDAFDMDRVVARWERQLNTAVMKRGNSPITGCVACDSVTNASENSSFRMASACSSLTGF